MNVSAVTRMGTLLAVTLFSFGAQGNISVTGRHLMILKPGIDSIWGSYVFAVQNDGDSAAPFKFGITLPEETSDFLPQEGATPEELSLSDDGVVLEKQFPPGLHIVSIGFKTETSLGQAKLTLKPRESIENLTLLLPRNGRLQISSPGFDKGRSSRVPDPQYEGFEAEGSLAANSEFVIILEGVPEGRGRLWWVGGSVAVLVFLAAGFLAVRTRPRLEEDESSAVLTG